MSGDGGHVKEAPGCWYASTPVDETHTAHINMPAAGAQSVAAVNVANSIVRATVLKPNTYCGS